MLEFPSIALHAAAFLCTALPTPKIDVIFGFANFSLLLLRNKSTSVVNYQSEASEMLQAFDVFCWIVNAMFDMAWNTYKKR